MLIDSLNVIVAFARTQLVSIGLIGLFLILLGMYQLWSAGKSKPQKSADAYGVLNRNDAMLIDSAIARLESSNPNREAYVRLLGRRLEDLVSKHHRSDSLSRSLGVTALCAANVSLFVTGSGFFTTATVGVAFCVNSVGLIASGLSMFFNAESESADTHTLSEKLRLEILQFIGSSSEYTGLSLDDSFDLFSLSIDKLLGEHLATQESALRAKLKAKNSATDES
jgi:hypothetical protein